MLCVGAGASGAQSMLSKKLSGAADAGFVAACYISMGVQGLACVVGDGRITSGFKIKFVTDNVGDCDRCSERSVDSCLRRLPPL